MGADLTISYDEIGDILYVDIRPSQSGERTDELSPGVLVRSDPVTSMVLGFEVQGFRKRASGDDGIRLPIEARFASTIANRT